jgi:hypothetical protein
MKINCGGTGFYDCPNVPTCDQWPKGQAAPEHRHTCKGCDHPQCPGTPLVWRLTAENERFRAERDAAIGRYNDLAREVRDDRSELAITRIERDTLRARIRRLTDVLRGEDVASSPTSRQSSRRCTRANGMKRL